jgi:hypothetical protein
MIWEVDGRDGEDNCQRRTEVFGTQADAQDYAQPGKMQRYTRPAFDGNFAYLPASVVSLKGGRVYSSRWPCETLESAGAGG